MRLVSLGHLRLEELKFRREKPLLLLAYLSLEGPRTRRFMAQLFWPDAPNAMNNLAVAITHLRRLHAGDADERRVWAAVPSDAGELRDHLRAGNLDEALKLYGGPFADSVDLDDSGTELEDWVLDTRETLARELRAALLWHAEAEAREAQFERAAQGAETAYRLPGAPPPEPEDLPRFYALLRAAEHPLCGAIEREARDLGLTLEAPVPQARGRLRPPFVGRERELERLRALEPGQWAWVRGGAGQGKTALLREVASAGGHVLPARAGLPYATLEPLLGDLEASEAVLLRRLGAQPGRVLIDDWAAVDPESRTLLERLHALRPDFPVILAGTGEPPLPVDLSLELGALSAAELRSTPGAFEATGGLPTLVGAFLRGEPLDDALDARLGRLGATERLLYAVLTLQPGMELGLIRAALNLPAPALVEAHEHLRRAGLIDQSGLVRGLELARHTLDSDPEQAAQIHIALARHLPPALALPHYQAARHLWEDSDLDGLRAAHAHWGEELLRRGFPGRAVELLAHSPASAQITLLRAQALERGSLFRQALDVLLTLPQSPETRALESRLRYKLGDPAGAEQAARDALTGSLGAEAEALTTLGEIALRRGNAREALDVFSRAETLWQAAGQTSRWVWAINNRAVARVILGEGVDDAFREVLAATEQQPSARAMVMTNMAQGFLRSGATEQAAAAFREAIRLGQEVGNLTALVLGWNGLGILSHFTQPDQARRAYRAGLEVARQTADASHIAMLLANLAELDGDIPAWNQAIDLLERGGFHAMAVEAKASLESFMGRSGVR
ncbi:ATP-binding protein [Deinococcus sp. KSM4-11]|uniref:ATP-binding protein n=1 Tax=Deinococcus sp. KSM4-11 TaxID=2568654 RepID=UPI0010A3AF4B|nr:ATP-binding protein [Deinococcus sp. KSM4-11]THF85203.1 ATP-binding protein [Deinococcus sp. KSM4-11]